MIEQRQKNGQFFMLRWSIFAGPVTNKKATQNRNIKLKLQVKTSQDRGSFKPFEPPLVTDLNGKC